MNSDVLTRNHVNISGRGQQAILFAHGFGCDQNMWRFVTPAFARDYKVVLFDHVGSGRSDRSAYDPKRYGTLDAYASDILEICETLELKDVIFVGHSVSSVIGILAANRAPGLFAQLVLVAPSPRYLDDLPDYVGGFGREEIEGLFEMMDRNYMGWARFMAPVVVGAQERSEHAEELEQSFCANDPEIARQFARVTFLGDHRSDLVNVRTPSLILQCSDDALAPPAVGRYMRDHIPGSTLVQLKATGHCPHLTDPAETIEAILQGLGRSALATAV